jgi:hypothetical protein
VTHKNFLPPSNSLNNISISRTALGIYLSLNVLDTDIEESKKHLSAITMVKHYIHKLYLKYSKKFLTINNLLTYFNGYYLLLD